jgi:hypothetical protein
MATDVITDADIDALMRLAAGYGSWFVGVDETLMMERLREVQAQLREQLATAFGPDVAAVIAAAFPDAVVSARQALEAAGGTPRVFN